MKLEGPQGAPGSTKQTQLLTTRLATRCQGPLAFLANLALTREASFHHKNLKAPFIREGVLRRLAM